MKDYIALHIYIDPFSQDIADLLADALAEIGFESFTESEEGLDAFIPADSYDAEAARKVVADIPMEADFSLIEEKIEGRDWNEEWEKNYFKPILIDGKCSIHASFHEEIPEAEYDILIDPKMAFGTGHHATTSGMVRHILELDLEKKHVVDIGTGTGILAILSKKRGATKVDAIEIDPFAADNARENTRLNDVDVNVLTGDASLLEDISEADVAYANINRNIILEDIERYVKSLKKGGILLLSGFYRHDLPMIEEKAKSLNLTLDKILEEDNWVAVKFIKA